MRGQRGTGLALRQGPHGVRPVVSRAGLKNLAFTGF